MGAPLSSLPNSSVEDRALALTSSAAISFRKCKEPQGREQITMLHGRASCRSNQNTSPLRVVPKRRALARCMRDNPLTAQLRATLRDRKEPGNRKDRNSHRPGYEFSEPAQMNPPSKLIVVLSSIIVSTFLTGCFSSTNESLRTPTRGV